MWRYNNISLSLSLSPSLTSTAPKFDKVRDNFSLCVVARLLLKLGTDVAKLLKQIILAWWAISCRWRWRWCCNCSERLHWGSPFSFNCSCQFLWWWCYSIFGTYKHTIHNVHKYLLSSLWYLCVNRGCRDTCRYRKPYCNITKRSLAYNYITTPQGCILLQNY